MLYKGGFTMFKWLFLVIIAGLYVIDSLEAHCLFCPCEHSYQMTDERAVFTGIKKVQRFEHVRGQIGNESPIRHCSFCMSCDHEVITMKKCMIQSKIDDVLYLCKRCL